MTTRSQTINRHRRSPVARSTFGASFRAGLLGGFAISLLLIVRYISPDIPILQMGLIPPAMFIVWTVTGIGAAMLCDVKVVTSKEYGRAGLVAGIISGTLGGITAMIIAFFGLSFQDYGQGALEQLYDTDLTTLMQAGFTEEMIILSGSILTALAACGLGGMVIAGLLGWFGGWLYPKFGK